MLARNPDLLADPSTLERLILRDQLFAVRRSVLISLPANMLLGGAALIVATRAGHGALGAPWCGALMVLNLVRMALIRAPIPGLEAASDVVGEASAKAVDRALRISWMTALASGLVWAFVPMLCNGYADPQSLFFLTVVCGITAGAVTHGTACARIPICFITPPLVATAGWLAWTDDFDRRFLAAVVVLYLVVLIRVCRQSESVFREASRLKNEATGLAQSLEQARQRASALADAMHERATHDVLTGLLNRAGFMQALEAAATDGRPHALLLLDLDGFKSVNDLYGHKMGDRVLAVIGERLREVLPPSYLVARLGGDEFAVSYAADDQGSADDLAARLIPTLTAPIDRVDAGRLGVSIGIYQAAMAEPAEMLSCADEALYAAKRGGRNRACRFDETLRGSLDRRRDCERDVVHALEARTLEVWFQPIHGEGGRTLASLEALLRWRHPKYGWVSPPDIIAAAAGAGLAEPLLRFILDEVCAMIGALRQRGSAHVRVAMNVSPRQISQFPVDAIVIERLSALGLPANALEIEITEDIALDISAVRGKLTNLSRAGICLTIDDFGVGYSSLASLRQLRVDRIKIDRSFVTGIAGSEDNRGLVDAILSLARSLRIDVVAEGVETESDLRVLQAAGCNFMQGYHLGRPAGAHAVLGALPAARSAV